MKNISELISYLKERRFFLDRDNTKSLQETEDKLHIKFPEVLNQFYTLYNGGFIPDPSISVKKVNDGSFYAEMEWKSNSFLCLEDIFYYYNLEDELSINFKKEEYLHSKRLIPFFRTKDQEFLAFTEDCLILQAIEIGNDPILWLNAYNNFESLLTEYIDNDGKLIFK